MDNKTRFKPYQLNQLLLLPPDMKQWLPEGDLAYFIMDMVNQLDLDPEVTRRDPEGQSPIFFNWHQSKDYHKKINQILCPKIL